MAIDLCPDCEQNKRWGICRWTTWFRLDNNGGRYLWTGWWCERCKFRQPCKEPVIVESRFHMPYPRQVPFRSAAPCPNLKCEHGAERVEIRDDWFAKGLTKGVVFRGVWCPFCGAMEAEELPEFTVDITAEAAC